MGNVIASTEQMIEKINDVLKTKRNAVVIITGDRDFAFEDEGISSVENPDALCA